MIAISLLALLLSAYALWDQNQTLKEIRAHNLRLAEVHKDIDSIMKAKPIFPVWKEEDPDGP